MNHAQCRITVLDRIYDDTNGKQIKNLIQSLILIHHLFIDTKEMFGEMHRTAEYGIAAHWKYKEASNGNKSQEKNQEEEKLSWLRQILEFFVLQYCAINSFPLEIFSSLNSLRNH